MVPRATTLGWLIDSTFHEFELTVPVISKLPPALLPDQMNRDTVFTVPPQAIALSTLVPVSDDSAYRMEVTDDQHLVVYTITTPPAPTDPKSTTNLSHNIPLQDPEEPYTRFHEQVQQVLKDADAISSDKD